MSRPVTLAPPSAPSRRRCWSASPRARPAACSENQGPVASPSCRYSPRSHSALRRGESQQVVQRATVLIADLRIERLVIGQPATLFGTSPARSPARPASGRQIRPYGRHRRGPRVRERPGVLRGCRYIGWTSPGAIELHETGSNLAMQIVERSALEPRCRGIVEEVSASTSVGLLSGHPASPFRCVVAVQLPFPHSSWVYIICSVFI